MRWHIHNWKISGTLSWLIKISTLVLGWHILKRYLTIDTETLSPALTLSSILFILIIVHYLFQFAISFSSKEILSLIGNLSVVFSACFFLLWLLTEHQTVLASFFALFMIMAEAIHVLFYFLNSEQPLRTTRTISLWLIGTSIFLWAVTTLTLY
ncbi:MAG: hypothetical protein ACOCPM_04690 [Bacteroidales bacterium]